MKLRLGFSYEQRDPGLYIFDEETGYVLLSDDVPEIQRDEQARDLCSEINKLLAKAENIS